MAKGAYLNNVMEIIENLCWKAFLNNKKATNKEIAEIVNKGLKAKKLREVSQATIDRIMADIHEKERTGKLILPLDKPWSIGSGLKVGIPSDFIPQLILMQQFAENLKHRISIRESRWFAYLNPYVQVLAKRSSENIIMLLLQVAISSGITIDNNEVNSVTKLIKMIESQDLNTKQNALGFVWLFIIGVQYAKQDKISEYMERGHLDTSELDDLYFVKGGISAETLLDGLEIINETPGQRKQKEDNILNYKNKSAEELEAGFGTLDPSEVNSANSLLRAFSSGYVPGGEWIKLHPEEWAKLEKKMEAKQ